MLRRIIGAAIGGALGFVYYKFVGCSSGTCPITSKPLNSILYGAVMGLLISLLYNEILSEIREYKMKHSKQLRLENPKRVIELDPYGTLKRINIDSNDVICDVGAGSGIFTIPAAQLTRNRVYALETDNEMLVAIEEKAKNEGLLNIDLIRVEDDNIQIKDKTVNIVLLVTVLHEIENKLIFLQEIRRVLKEDGRIMLIEFYKHETPIGPPVSHRIAREEVEKAMGEIGFLNSEEFALGDNVYCLVFKNGVNKNETI